MSHKNGMNLEIKIHDVRLVSPIEIMVSHKHICMG